MKPALSLAWMSALTVAAATSVAARDAWAQKQTIGNVDVGAVFFGNGSFGGLALTAGGDNNNYAFLTDANNTYINAGLNGTIMFRHNNGGPLGDPTGFNSDAFIDNNGTLTVNGLQVQGGIGFFNGATINSGGTNVISVGGGLNVAGNLTPIGDNSHSLGQNGDRWTAVWAVNGMIQTSDRRFKKDVQDLRYGLADLRRLHPVSFRWNSGADKTEHLGLIAQEVEKVIPTVISHGAKEEDALGLNYAELVPVLINGMQEQQKLIERQEARMAALERGRTPALSYLSSSLGGLALGCLLPVGFVVARRRRESE